ncbi:MAG TPA: GAF domain-containing protein [Phototrophicaceae bacterium]|nr:GAF domain-containing protein [Phototrophicaceae bacterium]
MIAAHNDSLSQIRQRYLQVLAIGELLLVVLGIVVTLAGVIQLNPIGLALFTVLSLIWLFLFSRGQTEAAAYGVLASLVLVTLLNPVSTRDVLLGTLAVITAAVLVRAEVYVIVNLIVLGKLAVSALALVTTHMGAIPPELATPITALLTIGLVSVVTRYFMSGGQRAVVSARSSADLIQAASEVGQSISQILDVDELLNRTVDLISARFKHYHVQIFLVNETHDQAVLVASTGDIGKMLLSRHHQLSVGSQSVIGQVVLRSAPVLVNDTSRDPIYYQNDLLTETRAELAFPIHDGAQTIGVLDIQSLTPNVFNRIDLQALQLVSDLLAIAFRNARLSKRQMETQDENERLYRDTGANLREIQRLNQQLTRVAWQNYHTDPQAVDGLTLEKGRLLPAPEWSEPLLRAGQQAEVVQASETDHKTVAVPVILRGEVIGAIEVEAGTENSPETVEMVQAVAQRLALSLENARLYQVTLEAAAQEQRINDIAARFQSVATVDELLRITLSELSETLGAETGSIRLGQVTPLTTGNGTGSASND